MNKFNKTQKGLQTLLCLLLTNICFSQTAYIGDNGFSSIQNSSKEKNRKKSTMAIEISSYILPKARIIKTSGNYKLQSRLQSAYDIGVNFIYTASERTAISYGIHYIVGKRNFDLNVPSEDVRQFNSDGRSLLDDKELWGAFRFPILIEKKIDSKKWGEMLIKAGLSIRYSGLMTDLRIAGGGYYDQNNQLISIFSGDFSGDNNYKPWLTFIAGGGKIFSLKNKNILAVCLQADISGTYFYTGTYEITIPNQPIATGTYKISGTSLGLSVQYIFTGENKRLIRMYEKEKKAF
jgi:hypothetical protein